MPIKRNVYLKMKSLEEARRILQETFGGAPLPGEPVTVPQAVGRVLAEPVFAALSSPNFHAAAMDGIAVQARQTFGASETRPRDLAVGSEAFFVNTGHVMPEGTDAVIMIEQVQEIDDQQVRIEAPAYPWQYVRKMGEDIVATELLFPRNHEITAYCVGALLSAGVFEVAVHRKPKVLIVPTGSELVDWRSDAPTALKPGQVLESNSYVLGSLVDRYGGRFEKHSKMSDDLDAIAAATAEGLQQGFDAVLIIGGSSAGSEDYGRQVIERLGEILVHGVTMMPGKPMILGRVDAKPVFGMPGYPVSAIIAFEQIVRPWIRSCVGLPDIEPQTAEVRPTRKIASKLGVEEFLRVKLGEVDGNIVATSLPRGAGTITSITEADGIIRIPKSVEGLPEQQPVRAELLRPLASIHRTIVAVGSHDNSLDILADQLRADGRGMTLSSSHVGSMGGLMAVKKGLCHIAGTHLLDVEDGSYNLRYLRRYLPELFNEERLRLVHLVDRAQGLILPPGNPKNIRGIDDLSREDVTLINRQGGSGTRILLDYRLQNLGIDPADIRGYENEEFTHMAVAMAVLSGTADVGLGIHAAARALGLEFVPVVTEQYDLLMRREFLETRRGRILMETLGGATFQRRVQALGGYGTADIGKILL